jgi:hypothetical protein
VAAGNLRPFGKIARKELQGERGVVDQVRVGPRRLLVTYALLAGALFLFSSIRYQASWGVSDWVWLSFNVGILVLLVRGSRGAWLLSFFASSAGLLYGIILGLHQGDLTLGWMFVFFAYAAQVLILLTPEVRRYLQRTAHERAIRSGSSS